jgi:hypothetical protein
MEFRTFLAELKSDFQRDFVAGLIDDQSVAKWVIEAMSRFGENLMTLQDTVVYIERGEGTIPDNFRSLLVAAKCEAGCVSYEEESKDILYDSKFFINRVERGVCWDTCTPECQTCTETSIVENYYFKDTLAKFHYNQPTLLKLGKRMKRSACAKDCRNKLVRQAPYEINIHGTTLTANFSDGIVYMQYYGLEMDEDGYPIIPDMFNHDLNEFLEYHVKAKIYERKVANKDEAAFNMLNYFNEKARFHEGLALTSVRMANITPRSYKRLQAINRTETLKYELLTPLV